MLSAFKILCKVILRGCSHCLFPHVSCGSSQGQAHENFLAIFSSHITLSKIIILYHSKFKWCAVSFALRVDPALRDLVELRTVSVRLMVGLEDLLGLFQPRWFCDSVSSISSGLAFYRHLEQQVCTSSAEVLEDLQEIKYPGPILTVSCDLSLKNQPCNAKML